MKSLGKTYLIRTEIPKEDITEEGIIIPMFGSNKEFETYIGYIMDYGIGWTQDQKKDLIPINTKVILDYSKHAKRTKLIMQDKVYYIYKPEDILAIIDEQEE